MPLAGGSQWRSGHLSCAAKDKSVCPDEIFGSTCELCPHTCRKTALFLMEAQGLPALSQHGTSAPRRLRFSEEELERWKVVSPRQHTKGKLRGTTTVVVRIISNNLPMSFPLLPILSWILDYKKTLCATVSDTAVQGAVYEMETAPGISNF